MKFVDLLKLSTRMFKARTSRTLLTIFGMGVGIGAILFLVSLGYGLQKTLLERITTTDSLLTLDVSVAKAESKSLTSETIGKLEGITGVEKVSPIAEISSQGRLDDVTADMTTYAVDSSFFKLAGIRVVAGALPSGENKEEIVIDPSIAKVFLKSSEEMIGKTMTFSFFVPKNGESPGNLQNNSNKISSDKKYRIVGVAESESEESLVYVNLETLNFKITNFSQLKVKCRSNEFMAPVRENILGMGLLVSSLSDTVDQANKIFRVVQIVLMLFGVIALVVSAIGMFNTMTIALLERTSEIGIMKSIGASDRSVSMMFIMESAIMGFFGGLCGIIIGFLEGFIFNGLVNLIATQMGGEKISLFYSPLWFVLTIIIFATVVGIITGFVPARRASKIDPLDALRYK
jgi:putative ABC transport system permease protein